MTLAAYKVAKREVSFIGGSFEVRGLSLDDIGTIFGAHMGDVDKLFKMYEKDELRATAVSESLKVAVGIVKDAPAIVGTMIASCADEPEMVDVARKLSVDVQITAIQNIIELTFAESGGAKKFWDMMMVMVKRVRPMLPGEA